MTNASRESERLLQERLPNLLATCVLRGWELRRCFVVLDLLPEPGESAPAVYPEPLERFDAFVLERAPSQLEHYREVMRSSARTNGVVVMISLTAPGSGRGDGASVVPLYKTLALTPQVQQQERDTAEALRRAGAVGDEATFRALRCKGPWM